MSVGPAGLSEYLKRAFLFRWNLLLFPAAMAAAALTPWPDALIPMVLAGEAAYLGGLVSIPKFRNAVDAQVHKDARQPHAGPVVPGGDSLVNMVASLPPEARRRFDILRARCLEMRAIARGVGGNQFSSSNDLSTPALDRLLWIFLKLLISQQGLDRFLRSTNEAEIQTRLNELRSKLEPPLASERLKRSLQDNIAAQELRLQNYERARENAEYVRVELDRIEAKIHALAESGVNRQDPDTLSSQIEGVSESVQSTESAIREMERITGLVDQMQEPPAILETDLGKVAQ